MDVRVTAVTHGSAEPEPQVTTGQKNKTRCRSAFLFRGAVVNNVLSFLRHRECYGDSSASRRFCHEYPVSLYRRTLGTRPTPLKGHVSDVNHVQQVNGNTLVSASNDGKLHVWYLRAGNWQLGQALGVHENHVTGLAVLSPYRFVSCSADQSVIIWNKVHGEWKPGTVFKTEKLCHLVIRLTSEEFIVATQVGEVGRFHIDDEHCHSHWYTHNYNGNISDLLNLDDDTFVLCAFSGEFAYWRRYGRDSDFSHWEATCPRDIACGGENYPEKAVPICEEMIVVCYNRGHIVIWGRYQEAQCQETVVWRELQILKHGGKPETVKGIMNISDECFASYSSDKTIIFWRLNREKREYEQEQCIAKHKYPLAACLRIFPEHFWSLDNSGVIHCWRRDRSGWCHERQLTTKGQFRDDFVRNGGMTFLECAQEVASFSHDCVINIWPLYKQPDADE